MNCFRITLSVFILLFIHGSSSAQGGLFPMESGFYLQSGYAYSSYKGDSRHVLSLGVCKLTNDNKGTGGGYDGALSVFNVETTWSVSAIALFKDKKIYPGLKFAADVQCMIFAAKMEGGFTSKNFFLTPLLGITLGGYVEFFGGYNIVMFEGGGSGFQFSANLTMPRSKSL